MSPSARSSGGELSFRKGVFSPFDTASVNRGRPKLLCYATCGTLGYLHSSRTSPCVLPPAPFTESEASVDHLRREEALLLLASKPAMEKEARALVRLFGPDSCFGLARFMLHLIETALCWPMKGCLLLSSPA